MTGCSGRTECEMCGGRNTEHVSNFSNKVKLECHDCGHEWSKYTGVACSNCGSNNTKTYKEGHPPHREKVRRCFQCDFKETLNRLDHY